MRGVAYWCLMVLEVVGLLRLWFEVPMKCQIAEKQIRS